MDSDAFLSHLVADGERLAVAAGGNLDAQVPSCPGWTVRDLVAHAGRVFGQKAATVRSGELSVPETGWPAPEAPEGPEPVLLAWYRGQLGDVVEVLRSTAPDRPAWSWYPQAATVGFWCRRMAQEAVIHRVDAELARGRPGPVDPDLALDGIDEVLAVFLVPRSLDGDPPPGGRGGRVVVRSGGRAWLVTLGADRISLSEGLPEAGAEAADATVSGPADQVLLWLWGRAPDAAVDLAGEGEAVEALRRQVARAT
ncbi:MAG: maleylpyruvate isomerase family mycothiol-dependent enzyme [Acidimicrobiales bacterium]